MLVRYEALPPPPANGTFTTKCIAALGLGDNYPLINDQCVLSRWRPGQTWLFDETVSDNWQTLRVIYPDASNTDFCMAVDTDGLTDVNPTMSDVGASMRVRQCSLIINGTTVRNEALWRVTGDGNGTYWFRNLRNKLCLTSNDSKDGFTVDICANNGLQKYTLKTL